MGRPVRRYSGMEAIHESRGEKYHYNDIPGGVGVRQLERWKKAEKWTYPVPNGYQDPLTFFHLFSELMCIEPEVLLRASTFTTWLNDHRKAITWDSVTVGRVLSDICDSFELKLGMNNGILTRSRDYKGVIYVLEPNHETTPLAHKVLDELMELVELEIKDRAHGKPNTYLAGPLVECPSLRGEMDNTPHAHGFGVASSAVTM